MNEEFLVIIVNILFGLNLIFLYIIREIETGEKKKYYLFAALALFLISVWKLGGVI